VVEQVGLRILGVSADFKGLVTQLIGEYKALALRMLAAERLAQGLAKDRDAAPTHYENRLTADIGPSIGADAADVRRAVLDDHAAKRFRRLAGPDAAEAVARCRQLFDLDALLGALVAEVNREVAKAPQQSLAAQFLRWVDETLALKHAVLDEVAFARADIDAPLAFCVLEVLYRGAPDAPAGERFRNVAIDDLFGNPVNEQLADWTPRNSSEASPSAAFGGSPPGDRCPASPRHRLSSSIIVGLFRALDHTLLAWCRPAVLPCCCRRGAARGAMTPSPRWPRESDAEFAQALAAPRGRRGKSPRTPLAARAAGERAREVPLLA